MSATVQVEVSGGEDLEAFLAQIDAELRGRAAKKAVRAAGQVVRRAARARVSKPGYEGDKPGKTPLRDTIDLVVRDYGTTFVCLVGPNWPDGAHGHLVEFGHALVAWGHETPKRVPPYPFMRPASEETTAEQNAAMISVLQAALPTVG